MRTPCSKKVWRSVLLVTIPDAIYPQRRYALSAMANKPCKEREELAMAVAEAVHATFMASDGDPMLAAKARMAERKTVVALDQHKRKHGCG